MAISIGLKGVMGNARIFTFGPFMLIPEQQLLMQGDNAVRIGGRAFDLLTMLVERPGELVPKQELMARAWPTTTVDESNLKVNMSALRHALDDDVGAARYIATVMGRGYRFIAPVEKRTFPVSHRPNVADERARPANDVPATGRVATGYDPVRFPAPVAATDPSSSNSARHWVLVHLIGPLLPDFDQHDDTPSKTRGRFEIAGHGIVTDGVLMLQFNGNVMLFKAGP